MELSVCATRKSAYFAKNCEKISQGPFFKEMYGSRGCTQISLKSHNLDFTCVVARNGFRSFTLSDDISLTWKLKTVFNPFWWRQPLWRHHLTFCVKQKLDIICLTIVVYLARLVKKWKKCKRYVNLALIRHLRGGLTTPW